MLAYSFTYPLDARPPHSALLMALARALFQDLHPPAYLSSSKAVHQVWSLVFHAFSSPQGTRQGWHSVIVGIFPQNVDNVLNDLLTSLPCPLHPGSPQCTSIIVRHYLCYLMLVYYTVSYRTYTFHAPFRSMLSYEKRIEFIEPPQN